MELKCEDEKEKHLAVNSSCGNKCMFDYGGCWLLFFQGSLRP